MEVERIGVGDIVARSYVGDRVARDIHDRWKALMRRRRRGKSNSMTEISRQWIFSSSSKQSRCWMQVSRHILCRINIVRRRMIHRARGDEGRCSVHVDVIEQYCASRF